MTGGKDWKLYYLFQTFFRVFLSVTYLLFSYCAFIMKVKQCGTDLRARPLYRFLISWMRGKADLYHRAPALWDSAPLRLAGRICAELQVHKLWVMCIMYNLRCNICHHFVSSGYSECFVRDTSTFTDVQFFQAYCRKSLSSNATGLSLKTVMERGNVNSTRSTIRMDDFAGLMKDIEAFSPYHIDLLPEN